MKLHIKNFRSIKQLDLEIAPITVLYGHNGTGKSSALYAPLTLKNIVLNSAQHPREFFNYHFTRLGEFEEVVFDHNRNCGIELGISLRFPPLSGGVMGVEFRVTELNDTSGCFQLRVSEPDKLWDDLKLPVSFPYSTGNYSDLPSSISGETLRWNGLNVEVRFNERGSTDTQDEEVRSLLKSRDQALNLPVEELKRVNFVPLGRGFFQPSYSLQSVSPMIATEQDVTSLLASNEYLEYKVDRYMESILNRDFRVRGRIGSNDFSLNSIDRQTGVGVSLVNEGFGVNQLVHLLTKVLYSESGIVCIEEPEIHLHPTAIRRLARALTEMVREERSKHLIISTHSEQFIMSLLALVADGTYSPEDLAIYLVTKEGKESKFHRQQVNENGQVEGGLASFMEGELEDMKAFLGV